MRDPKSSVRYLGFKALSGGSRLLDFSFSGSDGSPRSISVEVPFALLSGPGHMTLQECAAICYETLKRRLVELSAAIPASIKLTSNDVSQHRKPDKSLRRR